MKVVVQKFGGKCVEPDGNEMVTADCVIATRARGLMPIVVVSAMGRELARVNAPVNDVPAAHRLERQHAYSTAELVRLVNDLPGTTELRDLDMLMACGEIISAVRMAHVLKGRGYATRALVAGQVGLRTDGFFGSARVVETDISQVLNTLERATIPVVAGFQGVSQENHEVTTLGEGGTDYTAICLAFAILQTRRSELLEPVELAGVEVYKDVDGVMTANPSNFPDDLRGTPRWPRTLSRLSYAELCAMSRFGADVIQAEAARMAERHRIAVSVLNFRDPRARGTVVDSDQPENPDRVVTGVADMPGLVCFRVAGSTTEMDVRIADLLAQERLNFIEVHPSSGDTLFGIKRMKYQSVQEIARRALRLHDWAPDFEAGQWALVTVVGQGMRSRVESTAARVEEILATAGVAVSGSISGEINYSVLVREEDRTAAIIALHDELVAK